MYEKAFAANGNIVPHFHPYKNGLFFIKIVFFYTEFSENICQIILYNTKWLLSKQKKEFPLTQKGCAKVTSPVTLAHPFVLLFLLFFLMTAVASASVLATCMSFPVVVFVMGTLHIRIILKCFVDKSFYCFICISGNSSEKLNTGCR